eukprot:7016178-Lingulodinium_polyedra.AAC.1
MVSDGSTTLSLRVRNGKLVFRTSYSLAKSFVTVCRGAYHDTEVIISPPRMRITAHPGASPG